MNSTLTVLGANSATPTAKGNPSCFYLKNESYSILFDCGEGAQKSMLIHKVKPHQIDHICISHLHGDHVYGLFGLISTLSLQSRTKPLRIYGPVGLAALIDAVKKYTAMHTTYDIEIIEMDHEVGYQVIYEDDEYLIASFPLQHWIPCFGYYWQEKSIGRIIKPNALEEFDIDYEAVPALRNGEDVINAKGEKIKNEAVTLPPRETESFAYCTDTLYSPEIVEYIHGVSTLYHEATYTKKYTRQAHERWHSTAEEAALIAQKAEASQLIIGHVSAAYTNKEIVLEEARETFVNTLLAMEGLVISINPDRKVEADLEK